MKSARKLHCAVIETLESRRLLSFAAPVSYSVGSTPMTVATGDFDGDGRSDVATANHAGNNVSVLLSNANGTLQAPQQFATGTGPLSVAVGDINNDGKRDIITANGGGTVSVLLGNGNGTFQPASSVTLPPQTPPPYSNDTTPVPQMPVSVVVGDLNADGKLDLVVNAQITFGVWYYSYYGGQWPGWQTTGQVNVLIGNGNGTFATANSYGTNYRLNSIDVGDFNNDSKLDVVTGSSDPAIWLGNGNGTLQQPPLRNSTYGQSLAVGDFDMDGKQDLVTAGGGFSFWKGQGTGAFPISVAIPVVGNSRSLVAGDVNGDGKLDLIASTTKTTYEAYGYYGNYGPTTIEYTKVLLGKGDGTFTRGISSTLGSYPDASNRPNSSALGDFNGDSRLDLVATDPRTGNIYVQLNELGWNIPGALEISDAASVIEGNTGTVNAVFTVNLVEAVTANVSVNYSVFDGSATLAGGDFVATSGTLTFLPGQTSMTIMVPVKGDRVGEFGEGFSVRLSDATNADIIRRDGFGTITDDEPWLAGFTGGTVVEGNSGTVPLTFTVTLSAPYDAPVTVTYATADSSAVSATDYVPVTGTVTFAPGQTTRTFTVAVKGDLVPEYTESVVVNLTGGTGVLIVNANQAYGTITDTDPNPTVSIYNVTRSEGNPGTETGFEFILSLSSRSEKTVSIPFTTAGGTATSGKTNRDFHAQSSYATFYPGQLFTSVYVGVIGDSRSENDETFFVNLGNPDGATIADGQAVGTILNDESRGKTWVGPATGGLWSTAGNWSPIGVPTATSLVRIAGASVTVSSSVSVSELMLDNYATLTVASDGSRVLRTSGLFIDYGYSTLNLNDNDMIVDYTTAAGTISPLGGWNRWDYFGIAGMVAYGSLYDATGILTTHPDALAGVTTLCAGEAAQMLGLSGTQTGLFSGQTVDATTVLIKYSYAGDANSDDKVDSRDLLVLASNWQSTGSSFRTGDFNYDGIVNDVDLGILSRNWQRTLAAPSPALPATLPARAPKRTASRLVELTQ